ncbi:MAG: VWA domain-containing protein [Acidobacteria bacterium]|nr:VWA domain-containing protein [Acidobacteriota bacterium]
MRKVFLYLFAASLFLVQAPAQQPPQTSAPPPANAGASDPANPDIVKQEQGPPIKVIVEEVNLQLTVSDGENHLVTDLKKEDFQIFEEKKPQQITSFARETDVPLRIGLMIDTSNSIRDRFEFEQRAASDFLRALLRAGKDKAFLASFDSVAELVVDFTDDLDKLIPAVQSLRSGGGTALYDAVYYGSRDKLLEEAPPTLNVRRAMVVVSDGEDNQSRHSRLQALEMAQRAEVTVYAISTNQRGIKMPGDKVLQEFADQTGGRFFQPATKEDMQAAFQQINADLHSQYTLSYQPSTPRDGRYHDIEVKTVRKGLRVRARRGYYATRPPGLIPPDHTPAPPDKSGAPESSFTGRAATGSGQ